MRLPSLTMLYLFDAKNLQTGLPVNHKEAKILVAKSIISNYSATQWHLPKKNLKLNKYNKMCRYIVLDDSCWL